MDHSNNRRNSRPDNSARSHSRSGSFRNRRGSFRNRNRNRRRGPKPLDPNLFIQKAQPVEEVRYEPTRSFAECNLHPGLARNLEHLKFTHPTEIQDKTFEAVLSGQDVLGIAETGTGKTGAFLLPLIQRRLITRPRFSTLVVVPTRELAEQVEQEFMHFTKDLHLYSACCMGGTDIRRQIRRLSRKQDLVVGTPGRLLDLAKRGVLKLEDFSVLVLDEVDRMLDMGFVDDVKMIVAQLPLGYQTLFFSATKDKAVQPLIDELLQNPYVVEAATGKTSSKNVEQNIIRLQPGEDKNTKLVEMLNAPDVGRSIIFSQTKREVENIYHSLRRLGVRVDSLSGDKSQSARKRALDAFKKGKIDVLVATDVAARGIDVKGVTHVFNYEIPQNHDDYIHRIGRTGRAGKQGWAFTFVD